MRKTYWILEEVGVGLSEIIKYVKGDQLLHLNPWVKSRELYVDFLSN